MFADLLRIKKFREDVAARAVMVATQEATARRRTARDAEAAVERHRDLRITEEDRLFEEIKGTEVPMKRLDAMKAAVALLRDDELRLEQEAEAARQAVPPAEAALRQAEAAHRSAVKATQKFAQFVEIQHEAERKKVGRREEAELEESSEAGFAAAQRGAS